MKPLLLAVFVVALGMSVPGVVAKVLPTPVFNQEATEHGGGCRKSSPPGMCCHMDRKRGVVHCH